MRPWRQLLRKPHEESQWHRHECGVKRDFAGGCGGPVAAARVALVVRPGIVDRAPHRQGYVFLLGGREAGGARVNEGMAGEPPPSCWTWSFIYVCLDSEMALGLLGGARVKGQRESRRRRVEHFWSRLMCE